MKAAIEAATGPARRAAADIAASMRPLLQMSEAARAAMLPTQQEYERLTASLLPASQVNEMLAAALQLNTPQVDALSARLADVVRMDVQKMLPLLEFRPPAQLLLPHLDGMISAARIASEIAGARAAADAAMRLLEESFDRDLDEELEELLRDGGGLLQGEEREQAVEDAARIADLVQQEGASVIDLQEVVAWLSRKLAWAKDLSAAQKIELILVAISTAVGVATMAITLDDRGQVEEKISQLERKVDEGFQQQHEGQQETNAILRRLEKLLEQQVDRDKDDESGGRGEP
jgi:hypothetical protein